MTRKLGQQDMDQPRQLGMVPVSGKPGTFYVNGPDPLQPHRDAGAVVDGAYWWVLEHWDPAKEEPPVDGPVCPNIGLWWVARFVFSNGLVDRRWGVCPVCQVEPKVILGPRTEDPTDELVEANPDLLPPIRLP